MRRISVLLFIVALAPLCRAQKFVTSAPFAIGKTIQLKGGSNPAGTLQAAIDSSGANSTIVLPADYAETITARVRASANHVTVRCESGATITRNAAYNGNMVEFSGTSGFHLLGCTLNGAKANVVKVAMSALIGVGASDFELRGNRILNSPGQGIGVGGVNDEGAKFPSSSGHIVGNTVTGSNDHGIDINGSHNISLEDNEVSGCERSGLFIGHGDTYSITAIHNKIHDNGTAASDADYDGQGVMLTYVPFAGESITFKDVQVLNNTIYRNRHCGIQGNPRDSIISGNAIRDNNQADDQTALWSGICLDTSINAPTGNVVSNNRAYDTQVTKTQSWGIRENSGDNNVFLDNQLDGNKSGTLNSVGAHSRVILSDASGTTEHVTTYGAAGEAYPRIVMSPSTVFFGPGKANVDTSLTRCNVNTLYTPGYFAIGAGGSAAKAACWKADGKTLGACSTALDVNGNCTCN